MRDTSLASGIIIAIGVIVAAILFALTGALLDTADTTDSVRIAELRQRLDRLEQERFDTEETLRRLQNTLTSMQTDVARMRGGSDIRSEVETPSAAAVLSDPIEESGTIENMTEEMRISREGFNQGITQPNNAVMLEVLGRPRQDLGQDCRSVTSPKLSSLLETKTVGPLRVTLVAPAMRSLERIVARLKDEEPELHDALGTAGGLCVRLIRGSTRSISNHSWGTAIDIKLEDRLDAFANSRTQAGLVILAQFFNDEGWFWGATYGREDSMHFEVGAETLRAWKAEGAL